VSNKLPFAPASALINAIAAKPGDKRSHEDRDFDFSLPPNESILVTQLIGRATSDAGQMGIQFDQRLAFADLVLVHKYCGGLHLLRMLMSERSDFANDFVGIAINLDRRTGRLMNGFVPRFTQGLAAV
jgi:hypothetical protein